MNQCIGIGIPLPLPPCGGLMLAFALELSLFVIVSSTDKIKLVASVALFKALILTKAGSHTNLEKLSPILSVSKSTPYHFSPLLFV